MCKVPPNSIQNCDRSSDDRQRDRQTDAGDLIISPMPCYAIAMGQIIDDTHTVQDLVALA